MRWPFRRRDKRWRVNVGYIGDHLTVEATDHPALPWAIYRGLFLDVLERVFRRHQAVSLSQLIGVGQGWNQLESLGNLKEIQASIHERFSIETTITSSYDSSTSPGESDLYYVIHTMGVLERPLLEDLVGFGVECLANIAYGLSDKPECWPTQVLEWNEVFVRWFWLGVEDTILENNVLDHVDLAVWTQDGHPVFATKDILEHEAILGIIAEMSSKHKLDLTIGQRKVQKAYVSASTRAESVTFDDHMMQIALSDGYIINVPIVWFPLLYAATPEKRTEYEISGGGISLHWPDLDEDLSVTNLLRDTYW